MKSKFVGASFSLMLFPAGVLGISSAQAGSVDPATFSIQFGGIPGAVDVNGATPQAGAYHFFGGSLDVTAAAQNTAQPKVSVDLTSGGCTTSCAGGGYGVTSTVVYQFEVTGAAGVMVPYYIDTAGGVTVGTFSGQSPTLLADVRLTPTGGLGLTGFDASSSISFDGTAQCGTVCVNGTQHVSLLSDTIYTIVITASIGAFTNFSSTSTAWADPYIHIDPTFVGGDQFSLLISDGIGNAPLGTTPLPAALPLFATGIGALGLLGWRRKRKGIAVAAA